MPKITLRAPSGESIVLTTDPPPNEWVYVGLAGQGLADADLYTAQAVMQSGSTLLETLLQERTLSVSLYVRGDDRAALDRNLLKLNRVCNPLAGDTDITCENAAGTYRIAGRLSAGLDAGARIHHAGRGHLVPVTLTFTCCDPFFSGMQQYEDSLRYLSGGFRFPVSYPASFGVSGYEQTVINSGDTAAPVILRIRGACSRITLRNQTANQTLTLTRPLGKYEVLTIDTAPLNKSVVLEDLSAGVSRKAFALIDITRPTHAYWQLQPGANKISCDTEVENELVQVSMKWADRYAGI